jgi:hypothetical protein
MRFDDWMSKTETSNAAFGLRAGWTGETVRRYRNGSRQPDLAAMATIFDLTGGLVTPNDFVGVGSRPVQAEHEGGAS